MHLCLHACRGDVDSRYGAHEKSTLITYSGTHVVLCFVCVTQLDVRTVQIFGQNQHEIQQVSDRGDGRQGIERAGREGPGQR